MAEAAELEAVLWDERWRTGELSEPVRHEDLGNSELSPSACGSGVCPHHGAVAPLLKPGATFPRARSSWPLLKPLRSC